MNFTDLFEEPSTTVSPVVPTTCDCGRQSSTAGELTMVALSSVSVLKYVWPQIVWAFDSFISFTVQKVIRRQRRERQEQRHSHPGEQALAGQVEELLRLLPRIRLLVKPPAAPGQQPSRPGTPAQR